MNTISVNYTLVYQLSFADEYKWTKCGICFNVKTGKKLKQCYNGGSIGYNIKSRFYTLKYLRNQLTTIQKEPCPF